MSTVHRIRRLVQRFGIDIARYPADWSTQQLVQLLSHHGVTTVLDVGANDGQYALLLRSSGFSGRIVSFEPLAGPAAELKRKAARDPRWTVFRQALGDSSGAATINVAGNDGASSSLLPMLDRHRDAAPQAAYVGTEEVPVRRLDEQWPEVIEPDSGNPRVFLKLDVQGYEAHVLRGAGAYTKELAGMQLETSFIPLYEGGLQFADALALARDEFGLTPMAVIPGLTDPRTGQMLQCDLVFFRAP